MVIVLMWLRCVQGLGVLPWRGELQAQSWQLDKDLMSSYCSLDHGENGQREEEVSGGLVLVRTEPRAAEDPDL